MEVKVIRTIKALSIKSGDISVDMDINNTVFELKEKEGGGVYYYKKDIHNIIAVLQVVKEEVEKNKEL